MSYKIKINPYTNHYEYSLFKRKFLLWKKIGWDMDIIPFGRKVWEWQERYSIPDKNIKFRNFK